MYHVHFLPLQPQIVHIYLIFIYTTVFFYFTTVPGTLKTFAAYTTCARFARISLLQHCVAASAIATTFITFAAN